MFLDRWMNVENDIFIFLTFNKNVIFVTPEDLWNVYSKHGVCIKSMLLCSQDKISCDVIFVCIDLFKYIFY